MTGRPGPTPGALAALGCGRHLPSSRPAANAGLRAVRSASFSQSKPVRLRAIPRRCRPRLVVVATVRGTGPAVVPGFHRLLRTASPDLFPPRVRRKSRSDCVWAWLQECPRDLAEVPPVGHALDW